jgi:RNA polymerase sigma-70 factor (ECF subfamily)
MSKSIDNLTDAELVGLFNAGEYAAFEALVRRHSSRAYQIAYGVLGSREDAEEVAQDVFVRVHRALGKFRGDSEFTTWMYRIAMNLARNKYRWNKCRGAHSKISIDAPLDETRENSSGLELPDTEPGPDELVSTEEFERNIEREMRGLPPLYREALMMRNVDDMSYEQIAEALDCKLGTIKSRIARAREELRKRLGL